MTTLNLEGNGLGHEEAKYLANFLQRNRVILSFAQIAVFTVFFVKALTTLYLTNNKLSDEGTQHLANALVQNQVILFI